MFIYHTVVEAASIEAKVGTAVLVITLMRVVGNVPYAVVNYA